MLLKSCSIISSQEDEIWNRPCQEYEWAETEIAPCYVAKIIHFTHHLIYLYNIILQLFFSVFPASWELFKSTSVLNLYISPTPIIRSGTSCVCKVKFSDRQFYFQESIAHYWIKLKYFVIIMFYNYSYIVNGWGPLPKQTFMGTYQILFWALYGIDQ